MNLWSFSEQPDFCRKRFCGQIKCGNQVSGISKSGSRKSSIGELNVRNQMPELDVRQYGV
jgi:hypothetical protein